MDKPQCGYSDPPEKARIYHVNHNPTRGLYFSSLHNCSLFIKWTMCIFTCHMWCHKVFVEPQMHENHVGNDTVGNAAMFRCCLSFCVWKLLFIFLTTLRRMNVLEVVFAPCMRTVHQLSHFSGMDVNVIWFPLNKDLEFHVWTNEPSIIFSPDWKKINFSWFVVLFLIADVCSVSIQIIALNRGILGGKSRMCR